MMHSFPRRPEGARGIQSAFGRVGLPHASSFLCLLLSAVILGNAEAAETKIKTLALAPIPEATTIEIRLPVEEGSDDLKLAVTLADHFSVLLTELGYMTVEVDGELIFRFAAEEPTYARGHGSSNQAGLALEEERASPHSSGFHPVAYAGRAALSKSDEDTYRLRVSVARARKPPLWTGYIERSAGGAERQTTYFSMADALVAFWGRTYSSSD